MNKWFVIGGLLLVVSWLPFLVGELSRDAPPAGDEADAALAAGEPKVRVPVMPKPLAAEPPSEPAEPLAQEPEPPVLDEEPEALLEDEVAEAAEDETSQPQVINTNEITRQLKEAFESETRDSLWAKSREDTLGQLVGQAGVHLKAEDGLRCQRTVCRMAIEISSDDSSKMMAFYYAVLRNQPLGEAQPEGAEPAPRAFGIETLESSPERTEAYVYVGREGYHNVVPK